MESLRIAHHRTAEIFGVLLVNETRCEPEALKYSRFGLVWLQFRFGVIMYILIVTANLTEKRTF